MNQQVCASDKRPKTNYDKNYILKDVFIPCCYKLLKFLIFLFNCPGFPQGYPVYITGVSQNPDKKNAPFQAAQSAVPSHKVYNHYENLFKRMHLDLFFNFCI